MSAAAAIASATPAMNESLARASDTPIPIAVKVGESAPTFCQVTSLVENDAFEG
jgi:hypothetical protein